MSGHFTMAVKSQKETHDEDVTHPRGFNDGPVPAARPKSPYLSASVETRKPQNSRFRLPGSGSNFSVMFFNFCI